MPARYSPPCLLHRQECLPGGLHAVAEPDQSRLQALVRFDPRPWLLMSDCDNVIGYLELRKEESQGVRYAVSGCHL
jgi:hypothetical protein